MSKKVLRTNNGRRVQSQAKCSNNQYKYRQGKKRKKKNPNAFYQNALYRWNPV